MGAVPCCAKPAVKIDVPPMYDEGTMCNIIQSLGRCIFPPFTMVLEGYVAPEMSERDFIDLCCSIGESLDFCICVSKTITEVREFHIPDTSGGYKTRFSFHIVFSENHGTRAANKKFVEEHMANLLKGVLEDDLPVGLEGKFDSSGKKTFALIKVPS